MSLKKIREMQIKLVLLMMILDIYSQGLLILILFFQQSEY